MQLCSGQILASYFSIPRRWVNHNISLAVSFLCVLLCSNWSSDLLASGLSTVNPFTIPQGAYVAEQVEDRDHLSIMRFSGNYDASLENGVFNAPARAVIANEFYKNHPDNYDFLVVFTAFDFQMPPETVAFYHGVKNDTQGIGLPQFDNSLLYGSDGKLQGFIDMGNVSDRVYDPLQPEFEAVISTMAHETLHRWGIFVRYQDENGQPSEDILGRQNAHWSFFLDSDASVQLGHRWRDNGDGTFTAVAARRFYNPLDLYLMGFNTKEQVPPMSLITPTDDEFSRLDIPRTGVTVSGVAKNISIDDIIAVEGERVPAAENAQKEFRFGFIYLAAQGEVIDEKSITGIKHLRKAFVDRFAILTGGQGVANVYPEALPIAELGESDAITSSAELREDGLNISDALAWLRAQQNAEGYWQDKASTNIRDTAIAFSTLDELDRALFTNGAAAVEWLSDQSQSDTDSLVRKLRLSGTGLDLQAVGQISERINGDGGWGLQEGFESDPLDTAMVVEALAFNLTRSALQESGVNFLFASQNADGGWGSKLGGASDLMVTATAVKALLLSRHDSTDAQADTVITEALSWLVDHQNNDGGFGNTNSTVHETALSLSVFSHAERLDDIDHLLAIEFIASRQSVIGDFDGSIYTTALAVHALQQVSLTNLKVDSLTIDKAVVHDGDRVKLSTTITNDSRLLASASALQFYDGDPDAGGVAIGSPIDLPSINAYSSYAADVYWDTLGLAGEHTIYVVVDSENVLSERTRFDNQQTLSFTIASAPSGVDLAVTTNALSVIPDTPSSIPTQLAFVANVRNIGMEDTDQAVVQLWRGNPDEGRAQLIDQQTITVPGRTTTAINFVYDLLNAGVSEFTVVLDPDNIFSEESEDNNRAVVQVATQPSIDLEVMTEDIQVFPTPVILHQDAQFDVRIRNRGTLAANNVAVNFLIRNDNGTETIQSSTISLDAGESIDQIILWRADFDGDSDFIVDIDPQNLISETNIANNQAAKVVATQQIMGANLAVSFRDLVFTPNPAAEGFGVTLAATLINTGTDDLTAVEIGYFDGDPASGGLLIEDYVTVPLLAAGQSVVVQQIWPAIEGDANRQVFIVADPNDVIDEFNEGDNLAFEHLIVESLADLSVVEGSIKITPSAPQLGEAVSVDVTIDNIGKQSANDVLVKAYRGLPSSGGVELVSENISIIAGFSSQTIQFSLTFDQESAETIYIIVDPDNTILENDTTNNSAIKSVVIQNSDFYVSERYISPGDDGVKDATAYYFRLPEIDTFNVAVIDYLDRVVRVFDQQFEDVSTGSVQWDGRSNSGAFVQDGSYRFVIQSETGSDKGFTNVTVDTNRSALMDALDTQFQTTRNLTCDITEPWQLFNNQNSDSSLVYSHDTQFVYFVSYQNNPDDFKLPSGIYRANANGSDETQLVSDAVLSDSTIAFSVRDVETMRVTDDGEKLIFLIERGPDYQLWEVNASNGNDLRLLANVDNPNGQFATDFELVKNSSLVMVSEVERSSEQVILKVFDREHVSPEITELARFDKQGENSSVGGVLLKSNAVGDRVAVQFRESSFSTDGYVELLEDELYHLAIINLNNNTVHDLGSRSSAFSWSPEGSKLAVGDITYGGVVLYSKDAVELQRFLLPQPYLLPGDQANLLNDILPNDLSVGSLIGRFAGIEWNPDGSEFSFAYEDYVSGVIRAALNPNTGGNDRPPLGGPPPSGVVVNTDLTPFSIQDSNGIFLADLQSGTIEKHAVLEPMPDLSLDSCSECFSYHISVFRNAVWEKVGELHFGRDYDWQTLDLSSFIDRSMDFAQIKITQVGHEEAHIDQISILDQMNGFIAPESVVVEGESTLDALHLITKQDYRVIDALGKTIYLRWRTDTLPKGSIEIGLHAREATLSHLSVIPFSYPSKSADYFTYKISGNNPFTIDGHLSEDEASNLVHSELSRPDTGHPAAKVSAYIGSDDEYLYGGLDFGVDNTLGNPADWASIEVETVSGWETFRVTEMNQEHGTVGFVSTNQVAHEHKVYEFKLALADLGADLKETINIRFKAYGSAGIIVDDLPLNSLGMPVTEQGLPVVRWVPTNSHEWYRSAQRVRRIDWLAGSRSVLVSGNHKGAHEVVVVGFDSATPTRRVFTENNLSNERYVVSSPNNKLFTYYSDDDFDACRFGDEVVTRGYRQFESLLNLTADIRALRSGSAKGIILSGSAADKNFAEYSLEFAGVDTPDQWNIIAPSSQEPVLDGRFTTWVPPSEGVYLVRLTVSDLAGNTRQSITSASLSERPSIANPFSQPSSFSPNSDNIQDVVTLHFTVLEPVNLQFQVLNENDQLVYTQDRTFTQIGADENFVWDGRDSNGIRVIDGDYKLVVQGYEYFVSLDTVAPVITDSTPPLLRAGPFGYDPDGLIEESCRNYIAEVVCNIFIDTSMAFSAEDAASIPELNLEALSNQSGTWQPVDIVTEEFQGKTVFPGVAPSQSIRSVAEIATHQFRIVARDPAGNTAVKNISSGLKHDQAYVERVGYHYAPSNFTQKVSTIGSATYEQPLNFSPLVNVGSVLEPIRFSVIETIAAPIVAVDVMYQDINSELPFIPSPVTDYVQVSNCIGSLCDSRDLLDRNDHQFDFVWDPTANNLLAENNYRAYVRLTDSDGQNYATNSITFGGIEISLNVKSGVDQSLIDPNLIPDLNVGGDLRVVEGIITLDWESVSKVSLTVSSLEDERFKNPIVIDEFIPNGLRSSTKGIFTTFYLDASALALCTNYTVDVKFLLTSGQQIQVSKTLGSSCKALDANVLPVFASSCDVEPTYKVNLLAKPFDPRSRGADYLNQLREQGAPPELSLLTISIVEADGEKDLRFNVNDPQYGQDYSYEYDVADLPEGEQTVLFELIDVDGDISSRTHTFPVVKEKATLEITSPISGNQYCASTFYRIDRDDEARTEDEFNGLGVSGEVFSSGAVTINTGAPFNQENCHGARQDLLGTSCSPKFDYYRFPERDRVSFANYIRDPDANTVTMRGTLGVDAFGTSGDASTQLIAYNWSGGLQCESVSFTVDAKVEGLNISMRPNTYAPADEVSSLFLYSPNDDGVNDLIEWDLFVDESASATLHIYSGSSMSSDPSLVTTVINNLSILPGNRTFSWDGASTDVQVDDGLYHAVFELTDGCGNTESVTFNFIIDNQAPMVSFTAPQNNDPAALTLEVRADINDTYVEGYRLFLQDTVDVDLASGPLTSNIQDTLIGSWSTFGLLGDYTLAITSTDLAGNSSTTSLDVEVPARSDVISSIEPIYEYFSPNNDGTLDEASIRVQFVSDVTASFSVWQDGVMLRTLSTDAPYSSGIHTFHWDGLGESSTALTDGRYEIQVIAQDGTISQTEFVSVTLDNTAPTFIINDIDNGMLAILGVETIFPVVGTIEDAHFSAYSVTITSTPSGAIFDVIAGDDRLPLNHLALLNDLAFASEGLYQLLFRSSDLAGNITEQAVDVLVDKTPPVIVLDEPLDNTVLNDDDGVLLLVGSITELNLQEYNVVLAPQNDLDSAVFINSYLSLPTESILAQTPLAAIADGVYQLRITAVDKAGQQQAVTRTVVIDNTPPVLSIALPTQNSFITNAAIIQGTVFDDNLEQYSIGYVSGDTEDLDAYSNLTFGTQVISDGVLFTWSELPEDGHYTLGLTATDSVNHTSTIYRSINIDTTPPSTPVVDSLTIDPTTTVATLFWLSVPEADVVGYNVYRNGVKINTDLSSGLSFDDANIVEGHYRYNISAVDTAGLESALSEPIEAVVDFTAPVAELSRPANDSVAGGLVEITGTAFSPDDFKVYRLMIGTNASNLVEVALSSLSVNGGVLADWNTFGLSEQQTYLIRLEAEDQNGNVGTDELSVTIDNTAPATPLGLTAIINGDDIELSWSDSDPDILGYLLFRNDRLVNATGTVVGDLTPFAISETLYSDIDVVDGDHNYVVYALDAVGNLSDPSTPATVNIDTGAPHAIFSDLQAQQRFENSLYVAATIEDQDVAVVAFEYRVVGATDWLSIVVDATEPYAVQWDTTLLDYGDYQLRAVATDNHNNVDSNPEIVTLLKRDITAPGQVVDLTTNVNGSIVDLQWSDSSETDLAGYRVYRLATSGDPSTALLTVELLQESTYQDVDVVDGSYEYYVVAVDLADNTALESERASATVFTPSVTFPFSPTLLSDVVISGATLPNVSVIAEARVNGSIVSQASVLSDNDGAYLIPTLTMALGQNDISLYAVTDNGDRSVSVDIIVRRGELPSAVSDVVASLNATETEVDINWVANPEPNILGYRVYRNGSSITPLLASIISSVESSITNHYSGRAVDNINDNEVNVLNYWAPIFSEAVSVVNDLSEVQWVDRIDIAWTDSFYNSNSVVVSAWDGVNFHPLAEVSDIDDLTNLSVSLDQPYLTSKIMVEFIGVECSTCSRPLRISEVDIYALDIVDDALSFSDQPTDDGFQEYKVSALNDTGFEGPKSTPSTSVFGDVVAPQAVAVTALVDIATVTLNWSVSSSPDVAFYRIYRDGTLIAEHSDLVTLSYDDLALTNGTYHYTVRPVDHVGNVAEASNEAVVIVANAVLSAPTNVTLSVIPQNGYLQLNWQAAPDSSPSSYAVYRSLQSGSGFERVIAGLSEDQWLDNDIVLGTSYFYYIVSVDDLFNESAPSTEVTGTAQDLVAPAPVLISSPTLSGETLFTQLSQVVVAGASEPGSTVRVYADGIEVGVDQATVDISVISEDAITIRAIAESEVGEVAAIVEMADQSIRLYQLTNAGWDVLLDSIQDNIQIGDQLLWLGRELLFSSGDNEENPLRLFDPATEIFGILPSLFEGSSGVISQLIAYSADANTVVLMGSGSVKNGLMDFNIVTGQVTMHSLDSWSDWTDIALSKDGTRIAYVNMLDNELAVYRLDTETLVTKTFDSISSPYIDWSNDNNHVLFTGINIDGRSEAIIYDLETETSTTLTSDIDADIYDVTWSPDESHVLYQTVVDGQKQLRLFGLESNETETVFVGQSSNDLTNLTWSLQNRIIFGQKFSSITSLTPSGHFSIGAVSLELGSNDFVAFAEDEALNVSDDRAPAIATRVAPNLPDLTVTLNPNPVLPQVNGDVVVELLVTNTGENTLISTDANISIYRPDGVIDLSVDEEVPALANGQSVVIQTAWQPELSGSYSIVGRVDDQRLISERDDLNNIFSVDVPVVADAIPILDIELQAAANGLLDFGANTDVLGRITLTNAGNLFSGQINVTVSDVNGFSVATLVSEAVSDLPYAGSINYDIDWNTASVFSGAYSINVTVQSEQQAVNIEKRTAFNIVEDLRLLVGLVSDQPNYEANEAVQLRSTLVNNGGNAVFSGGVLRLSIRNSADALIHEEQKIIGELLPSDQSVTIFDWETLVNPVGQYHATLDVVETDTNQNLISSLVNFEIRAGAPQLIGDLDLANESIGQGTPLLVDFIVTNHGNAVVDDAQLIINVIADDTGEVLLTETQTASVPFAGNIINNVVLSSDDLALGRYQISLSYQVTFMGVDYNVELARRSLLIVDATAPTIEMITPQADGVISSEFGVLTFVAEDAQSELARVNLSINEGVTIVAERDPLDNGRFLYPLVGLAEGNHSVAFSATDVPGNTSNAMTTHFKIDNTPPSVVIVGVEQDTFYAESIAINITATDTNLKRVDIQLNDQPYVSGTLISTDGDYRLVVEAEDEAGNVSREIILFGIDTLAALINVNGVDEGGAYPLPVTPVIEIIDESLQSLIITLNGDDFVSGSQVSSEGLYVLSIHAVDSAGNESSLVVSFEIDLTSPNQPVVVSPTNNATVDSTPITLVGTSEPDSLVTIFVNNVAEESVITNTNGEFIFSQIDLSEGLNSFVLKATDRAGNVSADTVWSVSFNSANSIELEGSLNTDASVLIWAPRRNHLYHPLCSFDHHVGHVSTYHHYNHDVEALTELVADAYDEVEIDYHIVRSRHDFKDAMRSQKFNVIVLVNLDAAYGLPYFWHGQTSLELRAAVASGTGLLAFNTRPYSLRGMKDILGARLRGRIHDAEQLDFAEGSPVGVAEWAMDGHAARLRMNGGQAVGEITYQCSSSSSMLCYQPAMSLNSYGKGDTALVPFNPTAIVDHDHAETLIQKLTFYATPDTTTLIPGARIALKWKAKELPGLSLFRLEQELAQELSFVKAIDGELVSANDATWNITTTEPSTVDINAIIQLPDEAGDYESYAELFQDNQASTATLASETFVVTLNQSVVDREVNLVNTISAIEATGWRRYVRNHALYFAEHAVTIPLDNYWEAEWAIFKLSIVVHDLKLLGETEALIMASELLRSYQSRWSEFNEAG